MSPALEIARNFPHCDEHSDDSFLGRLHELRTWSVDEYWTYEAALYELARDYHDAPDLPREIAWRVVRIFSHAMLLSRCHFDPVDGCRIENLTDAQVVEWLERLQLVTEGFFQGEMPEQCYFAVPNPLLVRDT